MVGSRLWPVALAACLLAAGCATPPERVVTRTETVTVNVPVEVPRVMPVELSGEPTRPPGLMFVPADTAGVKTALAPGREGDLAAYIQGLESRVAAFLKWAQSP